MWKYVPTSTGKFSRDFRRIIDLFTKVGDYKIFSLIQMLMLKLLTESRLQLIVKTYRRLKDIRLGSLELWRKETGKYIRH